MTIPDYEEAQFEAPLMAELADSSQSLFRPGNVAERMLGFDGAVLSHHPLFWSLWGRSPGTGKPSLPDWLFDQEVDLTLPEWRLNLFVQSKRPQWMKQSHAKEWEEWKKEYFRFIITPHQQGALEICTERLGSAGLVVYAAPAIGEARELHEVIATQNVVNETNFVEAERLTGFRRYSYVAAGVGGKRHGSVEEVPHLDIFEALDRRRAASKPMSFGTLVSNAREAMLAAIESNPKLMSAWDRYGELRAETRELILGSLGDHSTLMRTAWSFVDTGIACWILRTRWLVGG